MNKIVDRAHTFDVRVMAALGGGGGCDGYLPLLDTPEEMASFNEKIMAYCEKYDLDGIDLDIELGYDHEIWKYYGDWVESLRPLCDERGYELSTATAQWVAVNVQPETYELFDFVNVMAYDNDGDESSHADMEFAESSLKYFSEQKKIPNEKLVLGVPFYGRGYTADGALDWGSYVAFSELVSKDPANYDKDVYNGIAYNGASTMREKCALAKQYGGIMIWEVSQDAAGEYSLLSVICDEMTTLVDGELPDWIPQTFAEALNFANKYGKSHVEDGLICCVRKEKLEKDIGMIDTEKSTAECKLISYAKYEPSVLEKPDESDKEAYREYLSELVKLGIAPEDADNLYADFRYKVYVYMPMSEGEIVLDWVAPLGLTYPYGIMHFDVSEDGTITQTDFSGYVPDCITEYNDFCAKNDEITIIQDEYIVYCGDVAKDGGYDIDITQSGTGYAEYIISYSITEDNLYPPAGGGSSHVVRVQKSFFPGTVKMTFVQKRPWEDEVISSTDKFYDISEDGKITEITEKESGILVGDCNLDGEFSIADVVTLQKWLINSGELGYWANADFDSDRNVDVFDLVSMKKALTKTA